MAEQDLKKYNLKDGLPKTGAAKGPKPSAKPEDTRAEEPKA